MRALQPALQHPRIQRGRGRLLTPAAPRATPAWPVSDITLLILFARKSKQCLQTTENVPSNFYSQRRAEGEDGGLKMMPKGKGLSSVAGSPVKVKCQVSLCLEQRKTGGSPAQAGGGKDGDKDSGWPQDRGTMGPAGRANRAEIRPHVASQLARSSALT